MYHVLIFYIYIYKYYSDHTSLPFLISNSKYGTDRSPYLFILSLRMFKCGRSAHLHICCQRPKNQLCMFPYSGRFFFLCGGGEREMIFIKTFIFDVIKARAFIICFFVEIYSFSLLHTFINKHNCRSFGYCFAMFYVIISVLKEENFRSSTTDIIHIGYTVEYQVTRINENHTLCCQGTRGKKTRKRQRRNVCR